MNEDSFIVFWLKIIFAAYVTTVVLISSVVGGGHLLIKLGVLPLSGCVH